MMTSLTLVTVSLASSVSPMLFPLSLLQGTLRVIGKQKLPFPLIVIECLLLTKQKGHTFCCCYCLPLSCFIPFLELVTFIKVEKESNSPSLG